MEPVIERQKYALRAAYDAIRLTDRLLPGACRLHAESGRLPGKPPVSISI